MKLNNNLAISESGFLFNPLTGDSFILNPFGVEIFQLLKKEKTYNHILEEVTLKYDVDEATFQRDYFDFTGFLWQFDLIEIASE